MEPTPSKPRQRSRAGTPFIMPDGRPLGLFLEDNQLLKDRPHRKGRRRPGAMKGSKDGWTSGRGAGAAARAAASSASRPALDGYRSDAEQMEAEALARVGQRRRRRFMNDKLLRDLAGRLTTHDMEALFKPVPFGDTGHVSLFTQATSPEFVQVWDLFRSVNMDKESRVLEKWEAHVRELQRGPHAIQNVAVDALAAWSGVSWKARQAMRRANPPHVDEIEGRLLAWLSAQGAAEADSTVLGSSSGSSSSGSSSGELVLELEDSFGRLIAHGLAEFHGLASHSRLDADGLKRVVLRRRRGELSDGMSPPNGMYPPNEQHRHPITCCDILALLVDSPEDGLNAHTLEEAYCHQDSQSDAGGVEQLAPLVQAQVTLVAVR